MAGIPIDDNGKPALFLWDDATGTAIPVHIGSKVTGSDGKSYAALDINVKNANANGQATMANSSPVVPASDYISPIKSARTEIAGQAAANVTGTTTDLIPSTDTTGYAYAVLQLTGTWSMTLQAQQCNDNATFLQTQVINGQTFISTTALVTNFAANGLYIIPLVGRYLRVRPSAWASNTSCVGTLELYTTLPPFMVALLGSYATLAPQNSGGTTAFHLVSANTTNQTNIKASLGMVYTWNITNTNAAIRYVKFHNTAGTPTAGTGVVRVVGVPAGGYATFSTSVGVPFSTGIAISTTTGSADSDATAVAAGDLIIDIDYK